MNLSLLELFKTGLGVIAEFFCLMIAIIYFRSLQKSFMKWTMPFLAFIFLAELICFFKIRNGQLSTIGIQSVISVVESSFYAFVFYHLSNQRPLKTGIVISYLISI